MRGGTPPVLPLCRPAVQEYTLIKMRVLELKGKLAALEGEQQPGLAARRC